MKKIFFFIPVFILVSCGGSDAADEETESTEDTIFANEDAMVVNAQLLKEKLGLFQASFVGIGDKEVEETICTESSTINYSGNPNEMNVWIMATYLLDNFSSDEFGKHDFKMPNALIRDVTPLTELNWINANGDDTAFFDIYRDYPDLTNIHKDQEDDLKNADQLCKAIQDGLLGVIAITDYLPPSYTDYDNNEGGYVMGYLMFADWNTGELSCISPLLAQNSEDLNFVQEADMLDELKQQTFRMIDSLATARTGFDGPVYVNSQQNLKKY